MLDDGASQYYTRAGNFNVDSAGNMVSASNGFKVQGWLADLKGSLNTNTPTKSIQLPLGKTIAPIATTKIQYDDNLNAFTNAKVSYGGSSNTSDTSGTGDITTSLSVTDVNQKTMSLTLDLQPEKDAFDPY